MEIEFIQSPYLSKDESISQEYKKIIKSLALQSPTPDFDFLPLGEIA